MATITQDRVLKTETLPVDAQDVVSEVRLGLPGEISGNLAPVSVKARQGSNFIDYQPLPIVHTEQHADHAKYGATLLEDLDDGIDPFLLLEDISFASMSVTESNISAGQDWQDPTAGTFETPAALGSVASIELGSNNDTYESLAYGFVIRYSAEWIAGGTPVYESTGSPSLLRFTLFNDNAANDNYAWVRVWYALPFADDPVAFAAIVPPNHMFSQWNQPDPLAGKSEVRNWSVDLFIQATSGNLAAASDFKLYEFYPLILNETRLAALAQSKFRLPAANPRQITVSGFVAPDAEHTFPGWPGGSIDVTVARQHHSASRTVIDVEQAGPTPNPDGSQGSTQLLTDAIATRGRMVREARSRTYSLRGARRR